MTGKKEVTAVGLQELFELFEDNISVSDITASKCLGKLSASIVKSRVDRNMTQKQFAVYTGVTQGMVSKWEGGDYNFTIRTLAEIAEKLDLELLVDLRKSKNSYQEQLCWDNKCKSLIDNRFIERNSNIISFKQKIQSYKIQDSSNFKAKSYRSSDIEEM